MKKFLLLGLAAVIALTSPSIYAAQRAEYVKHIETCEAILQEFQGNQLYAIPTPVLQRARGIIIINQFKAGFILGVTGGYGVIMVKRADGSWSVPVMIDAGEASLGLQLGGKSIETIFVLTDDQTPRYLFNDRFNVGVDAKAAIGPRWTEMESVNKEILNTPVLVYSKVKGLYAGATFKAGFIARDDESNRQFYRTNFSMPELLYGDESFVKAPPEVVPLMNYVKQITQ